MAEAMMGGPPPSAPPGAPPQAPPMPPQPMPVHDVKISRTKKYGCVRIENVPPEEFGVTKRQRSVMLRNCDYCYHEVRKTEAQLIADGYDEQQIKGLPSYAADGSEEALARDTVGDTENEGEDYVNRATRQILVTEHYVLLDYEKNDKPKRYRITTGGGQLVILKKGKKSDIEPDMVRFAAMTPYIMAHRFFGRSAADLVMDIQKINTALVRELLNNVYLANNQRLEVSEQHAGPNTLDDILSNRIGGIIRTKMPGGILPVPNQEIGSFVFPMLQYMEQKREWRTGVSRQGQGLDPQALQNIGEKAIMDAADSARAKTKLIARIFAETGIKELCWLVHATARQHATQADTVKLRNKWIQVDPREWKQRDDLTVNVGLGGGSREGELAALFKLLQIQGDAIKVPKMKLAKPENVYNLVKEVGKKMGLKTIEPFFTDPKDQPDPPPEPSPEEKKMQAEAQAKQQQMALDAKQSEQEFMLKEKQLMAEIALKQQQLNAELQMQREQFMMELGMKERIGMANASAKASVGNGVQLGGEPG